MAQAKKKGISFADLAHLMGLTQRQEEYILHLVDTLGLNLALTLREGLFLRLQQIEVHKNLTKQVSKPFCFCCGVHEDVFTPIDVPFPICRLCDRLPRGFRLMTGYLRPMMYTLLYAVEKMDAAEREAQERDQQFSVSDLEAIWREQSSEES